MTPELRLSVSKCKTFTECKAKFNFTYNLKLPRKERDFHIFGKFCHQILENFHNAFINGSQEPMNLEMSKAWKSAYSEYKNQITPEMKKEVWDITNRYLASLYKEKSMGISPNILTCEENFALNIDDKLILNGMIDRVQIDHDGILHIADYKSTKNKKYLKDDWFQLLTYAYVMYLKNPDMPKFRVSYILLRHDFEYLTKEFTVDALLSIKDTYIEYAQQMIDEKEFAPNPNVLCSWCDHLQVCSSGREYVMKHDNRKITHGEVSW